MKENVFEIVTKTLLSEEKYKAEDGTLLKARVYSDVMTLDAALIKLLVENERIRKTFFIDIDGVLVFDKQQFAWLIESKEFLPDSFTSYTNKIGLAENRKFISTSNDVVLDFPYKDCVLQGGQDKDDQKRQEIMFNETLASDEIRNMLAPKVFTNAKRYTAVGQKDLLGELIPGTIGIKEESGIEFNDNDNLVIKGNNLIVLSSLLKRYEGKVKLIYIDPPYNTKNATNNTFKYNNTFNRSTWLTFMKNRLQMAKQLLKEDGSIIVAIDENEQAYLGVLIDEIFNNREKHLITVVHNPRGIQGTNFSNNNEFLYYVIPQGKKVVADRKLEEDEIDWAPLRNWGGESLRTDAKNCFYPIVVSNGEVIGFGDVCQDGFHPKPNEEKNGLLYIYPIDEKCIERKWRYGRQTVEEIKHLLRPYNRRDGNIDIHLGKDFGQYKTTWIDRKLDSNAHGKQYLDNLVEDKSFTFPKSIFAVKEALYSIVANEKDCVIVDFFAGSGTTGEATVLINKEDGGNRKFILVEQMDYIESITISRIVNSTRKNNVETSILYCELKENAQTLIDVIQKATEDNISIIKTEIYNDKRIVPYLTREELLEVDKDFESLSLKDKKKALIKLVDKNKLYINYSDIDDEGFNISEEDKKFSRSFYEVD